MRYRIAILFLLALPGSCSPQKRCARIYRKNPECFQSRRDTLRDTISLELRSLDTSILIEKDTIRIPGPCGEIKLSRDSSGRVSLNIQRPAVSVPRERILERILEPSPCDCEKLELKIRDLKSSQKKRGISLFLVFISGLGLGFGLAGLLASSRGSR